VFVAVVTMAVTTVAVVLLVVLKLLWSHMLYNLNLQVCERWLKTLRGIL
jgi:hypothetical protein